jgi:hypothetical protein
LESRILGIARDVDHAKAIILALDREGCSLADIIVLAVYDYDHTDAALPRATAHVPYGISPSPGQTHLTMTTIASITPCEPTTLDSAGRAAAQPTLTITWHVVAPAGPCIGLQQDLQELGIAHHLIESLSEAMHLGNLLVIVEDADGRSCESTLKLLHAQGAFHCCCSGPPSSAGDRLPGDGGKRESNGTAADPRPVPRFITYF